MLIVCRWCVEEVLVPIVGAAGYCSLDCQEAASRGPAEDDDLLFGDGSPGRRSRRRVRLPRRLVVPRPREAS